MVESGWVKEGQRPLSVQGQQSGVIRMRTFGNNSRRFVSDTPLKVTGMSVGVGVGRGGYKSL